MPFRDASPFAARVSHLTVCLALGLLCLAAVRPVMGESVVAAEPDQPKRLAGDAFLELETYALWPGRAEGASSNDAEETPTMTVFRPQTGRANGTAVVVAPGGGYVALAGSLEGRQVADWFASRGITAFVLKYRVGPKARLPIPFSDGRRAIQFVRAYANRFSVDPARIGMIGFSAGGHLSATTAANPQA
ncbi:MAG: hypothetical protein RLZZ200_1536, partial [Pseudomonadota bacterium]